MGLGLGLGGGGGRERGGRVGRGHSGVWILWIEKEVISLRFRELANDKICTRI